MESNAALIIGVNLRSEDADPLELLFQQESHSEERIMVRVPRRLLLELGAEKFAGQVADYYLQQHPAEVERVGREALVRAVQWAIDWRMEGAQEPEALK